MVQRCYEYQFSNLLKKDQSRTLPKRNSVQIQPSFQNISLLVEKKKTINLDALGAKWKVLKKNETYKTLDQRGGRQKINRVLLGANFQLQDDSIKKRRAHLQPPKPEMSLDKITKNKEKVVKKLLRGKFSLKKKYSTQTGELNDGLQEKDNMMIEVKCPFFMNQKLTKSTVFESKQSCVTSQMMSSSLTLTIELPRSQKNKRTLDSPENEKRIRFGHCTVKKQEIMYHTIKDFSYLRSNTQQIYIEDVSGWKDMDDEQDDLISTQATVS